MALYNSGREQNFKQGVITPVLKCILLDTSYTFDPTHDLLSDVTPNEISTTGYTAGGVVVTGKTVSIDTSTTPDETSFRAADIAFPGLTGTANVGGIVIYYDHANAANRYLLCHIAGSEVTGTGFTVRFTPYDTVNANGPVITQRSV